MRIIDTLVKLLVANEGVTYKDKAGFITERELGAVNPSSRRV